MFQVSFLVKDLQYSAVFVQSGCLLLFDIFPIHLPYCVLSVCFCVFSIHSQRACVSLGSPWVPDSIDETGPGFLWILDHVEDGAAFLLMSSCFIE